MLVLHHAPTPLVITDLSQIRGVETNGAGYTEVLLFGHTSLLVKESVAVVKRALRDYQAKQLATRRESQQRDREMIGTDFSIVGEPDAELHPQELA